MDWTTLFAGGAFGIALTSAIAAAVNYIVKLHVEPLRKDIEELALITKHVKTEAELETLVNYKISRHAQECSPKIKEAVKSGVSSALS